jgi:predicted chitinase
MSYYSTLSSEQKNNIAAIVKAANDAGITNKYAIAGMLAIVSKESSFIPKDEKSYANTDNSRIRKVFGSRVSHLSDSELSKLKKDKNAFFDLVYKSTAGNQGGKDGSSYLGRGFNQLTGKGNYKTYADLTGIDIVKNPKKVNEPDTAAKVLIAYNKRGIDSLKRKGKLSAYNAKDINDFKNSKDATLAFYHATAGTGKDVSYVKGLAESDHLGGMTRALSRVNDLLEYGVKSVVTFVKKKPLTTVLLTATLVIGGYILVKYLNDK